MKQGCAKLVFNSLSNVWNCPHGYISWAIDQSDPENTKAQVECSATKCSSEVTRNVIVRGDTSFSDELIGLEATAQAVQNNIEAPAARLNDDFPKISEDDYIKARNCAPGHLSLKIPSGDEPYIGVKCSAARRGFNFGVLSLLVVVIAASSFHLS
ncbi:hypothetical protein PV08_01638 [Exophiala spinifera]|uniref:Uncharacterized protein n=1 Tax=Exophiala spinifera TaxID=91928 RepID=A0A0D2CC63_9EURO|nr:uncharacterized protein PV08_01638 [Exophiala spinifera]KIW21059.1 hypothetical protein PV08_01638 [Exophiala spinifera]